MQTLAAAIVEVPRSPIPSETEALRYRVEEFADRTSRARAALGQAKDLQEWLHEYGEQLPEDFEKTFQGAMMVIFSFIDRARRALAE